MAEAAELGDWLFVIDGDEWIHDAKPVVLEDTLDATSCDVGYVRCTNKTGNENIDTPQMIRRLYRASTGVTVDTAHNGYRTADGRWLHGDGCGCPA